MAERLTRNNKVNFYFHDEASNMVYYKLQDLEDIMEKYGIEDLEQYLQRVRKIDKELRDTIQQLHTIIDTIGYDRDTWKRACELASETLKQVMGKPLWIGGNIPAPEVKDAEYFYQKAKKY